MLVKINKAIFDSFKNSWLKALASLPEDFPKEIYQNRFDFINPERTDRVILTNDYALLGNDNITIIAIMAIAHVGPGSKDCYIKITDILLSPDQATITENISQSIETINRLIFSCFKISEGELKAPKIKLYGPVLPAKLFFDTMHNHYLELVEAGFTPSVSMGRYGHWLELTKLPQD